MFSGEIARARAYTLKSPAELNPRSFWKHVADVQIAVVRLYMAKSTMAPSVWRKEFESLDNLLGDLERLLPHIKSRPPLYQENDRLGIPGGAIMAMYDLHLSNVEIARALHCSIRIADQEMREFTSSWQTGQTVADQLSMDEVIEVSTAFVRLTES